MDEPTAGLALEHLPNNASLARSAVEMARRVGDKAALAYVLSTTMWAVSGPDDLEAGLAQLEEIIGLAEESGDERLAAEANLWRARYCVEVGDIAAADRETEIQEHYAATSRQAYHRWQAALARAGRALVEGRFEEAEACLKGLPEFGNVRHGMVGAVSGALNAIHEQQGQTSDDIAQLVRMATRHPQVVLWRTSVAARRAIAGQVDEARREFESLAANDFTDVPRNMMWFYIISRLCDVAITCGDVPRAAILYDLLLPYSDRCVTTGGLSSSRGAVSGWLGGLATLLSRYDAAERHFEDSLELNARMRARIFVAHTQHDYARMLVARDGPGDREKAAALSVQALATAREVGMKPLEAKLVELRVAAGFGEEESGELTPEAQPKISTPSVFRQEGDFWTITYDGRQLRLRDAKGLQYIARLIRNEGQEIHAVDLAVGEDEAREERADRGDAGEVLDPQARGEYKQRIADLEAELDEATRWGDTGRAAQSREEIEFLKDELSSAFGLGGRARTTGNAGERARKAVASRIQDTITKIGKEHPVLALHLENAVRTGVFCSYRPDRSPKWGL